MDNIIATLNLHATTGALGVACYALKHGRIKKIQSTKKFIEIHLCNLRKTTIHKTTN